MIKLNETAEVTFKLYRRNIEFNVDYIVRL